VNDEAICTAVVNMLARIGMRVTLNAQTRARFFAEVNAPRYNTSFYLLGWTPTTVDALNSLSSLAHTRTGTLGVFNNGGYSNPAYDHLLDQIAVETNEDKRQELISQASRVIHDDAAYIPLHQQQIVWAARETANVVQTPDNYFQLRYVKLNQR
jgi:peptide/nickel transport system substrate-binding protein